MAMKTPESKDLVINTDTMIGRADVTNGGTYSIIAVNRGASSQKVRVAWNAVTATMADAQMLVYDFALPATGEPLIIAGIPLAAGLYINARANGADVTVGMYGIDKDQKNGE